MPKYFSLFLVSCLPVPLAGFLFLVSPINAQTPTGSFTIKLGSFTPAPTIPRPTSLPISSSPVDPGTDPGNNEDSNLIYDLYNQIKKTCGGGIYLATNIQCIYKLKIPKDREFLVTDALYRSVLGQSWLQCIGFVRGLVPYKYGTVFGGAGHAIDFSKNIPSDYKWIEKTGKVPMRANDIPIWNDDTVGHIAYTTKINNSREFEVAEANLNCSGCVRITLKTMDNPHLIGWLRRI